MAKKNCAYEYCVISPTHFTTQDEYIIGYCDQHAHSIPFCDCELDPKKNGASRISEIEPGIWQIENSPYGIEKIDSHKFAVWSFSAHSLWNENRVYLSEEPTGRADAAVWQETSKGRTFPSFDSARRFLVGIIQASEGDSVKWTHYQMSQGL